ncbi:MAG: dimethyl sulfoxide reductase anchor subunit [Pseudomonadales bacterium]|nr:dimethyl sulfoxide reductase anchor subunit [Pseudomonadales bacterium]
MFDSKDNPQNKAERFPGDDLVQSSQADTQSKETKQKDGSTLWEIRTEERPYAFLNDPTHEETNRYGQKIDLIDLTGLPKERPMFINENPEVGTNPNRNKQHGFFFTADNCIGCHACEAACSEKNENPAHIAFRSVGYVEGGSYPDYKRMNISMACNHCDNPVCLKGCPTKAYTKHAEYGAVLQDPETCFGCGYCTWVCPYNAPQLDPIQGQVSKCNMCVDRLEVGLKPACVSACLGNALDFGVVENIPENREQAKTSIPGFPNPDITHPNIRFQQTRTMPDEMTRTDSMPVKYHKNEEGSYSPVIDQKTGKQTFWNLSRLSSRENPLVLFTLSAQAAIGAFGITFLGSLFGVESLSSFSQSSMYIPLGALSFLLIGFALFMSTMHLGKPIRFYRGFNNWRYSPVSREGLGIAAFMGTLGAHLAFSLPNNAVVQDLFLSITGTSFSHWFNLEMLANIATVFGVLAIPSGLVGLYYMNRCYRIEARPFWNHWQVATSFFGNMLSLGSLIAGTVVITTLLALGESISSSLVVFGSAMLFGLLLEAVGLFFHNKDMLKGEHEGAASHYVQLTTFGKTYKARNALIAFNLVFITGLLTSGITMPWILIGWGIAGVALIATATAGRALFYVLVIPTTMPGAFFWKNKGFEEHARDIGLANMPQVGVVPDAH